MSRFLLSLVLWMPLLAGVGIQDAVSAFGNQEVLGVRRVSARSNKNAFPVMRAPAPLARSIPFQLNANKIWIQVRINNAGPFWFILDSGAIFNVLDKERAQSLGIQLRGSSKVWGAGESSVDATRASDVSLEFAGIELKSRSITVLPVNSSLSHTEGRRIDGLLGYEFIRRYCIEIDYRHLVLNIYPPGGCTYGGSGNVLPIEIMNDALYVSGVIDPGQSRQVEGRFLIDTGFRTALALNTPYVESNHLLAYAGQTIPSLGVGIGGKTSGVVGRLKGLRLSTLLMESPVVEFSATKDGVLASGNFSGVIGGDILRRFKVVLDCPGKRLVLFPESGTPEPFEYDMSGISLVAEGKELNRFRVTNVMKNSPASDAGVQVNDWIEAVEGESSSHLTLEQISQVLKHHPGETHKLLLKRGQQQIETKITLRRLV